MTKAPAIPFTDGEDRTLSDVPWHRSLAGRVALAYVPLIALVLGAQIAGFLWLLDQHPAAVPIGLTRTLSDELGRRLASDPRLDLEAFTAAAHPSEYVFVVMKDGRTAGRRLPSEATVTSAVRDLQSAVDVPSTWESGSLRAVGVRVNGEVVGVLGILPATALERYGLPLAVLGLSMLTAGTLLAAAAIFGPVHRRIRELQRTAQRFGRGELAARARTDGRDEVTALARTLNAMADAIASREDALTASNRARQQLLADVSHELMTPLTAVLGHLETLTMPEVRLDDDRRLRLVAIARREAQRLERLVGDLLEIARLEAGGADLDWQMIPTRGLLELVLAHHDDECRRRNIAMTSRVAPDATELLGDPFRLEQALQNLTANALRHTPDGGAIQLTAEREGERIVLAVADSGEGIPPQDLPLIFDRFYKARASNRTGTRGSGLGLSIVKAIVTRHGGEVSAASTLGRGTTVRIALPAPSATADEATAIELSQLVRHIVA